LYPILLTDMCNDVSSRALINEHIKMSRLSKNLNEQTSPVYETENNHTHQLLPDLVIS
jgi:hypothetical protein